MTQTALYRSDLSDTEIDELFKAQQDFFRMGKTQDLAFRKATLKKLKNLLKANEAEIIQALADDFGKPPFESYASELGFVYQEISHTLKHLRAWARPKRVPSPINSWPSSSYVVPQAKGICLVIGPWNYPLMLMLSPVVAALAAGNTIFLKPPEQNTQLSNLISRIFTENFDQELISVIQGPGHEVLPPLLERHRFDHIFFTGSTAVGRIIAQLAAPKLTPCTLELGGKSPCIIDHSANLKVAAQRIAFGKWLNAGQTCVAPDYLLVQRDIKDEFLKHLKETLDTFYPQGALDSENYTSMVHQARFKTVAQYLEGAEIFYGGKTDEERLRIEPTLILEPHLDSPVMQEEIFGPVLPIFFYDFQEDARAIVDRNPNPLAFYLFSSDKKNQGYWKQVPFGGGAINNAIIHLANPDLPFGGIGESGYGQYHGKFGFDTFSHQKAIMKSGTWFDLPLKYPPYTNLAYKLMKRIMS